jgi:hypothetical protein
MGAVTLIFGLLPQVSGADKPKLVGGKLEAWSKPDSGTEIGLSVPDSTAYARPTARWRSWFARKGAAINLSGRS